MVKFKYDIEVYNIEKDNKYNYVEGRKRKEKRNRRLQKIEKYMRFHNLLFKSEYLAFCSSQKLHIRLPYIETICRDRKWIHSTEYLLICT